MTLENVCYRRDVMAVLNMVRQGLFGELIHLEGGYQHNLRNVLFNNGEQYLWRWELNMVAEAISEAQWRTQFNIDRDGDLYPTHGAGPLMHYANINRWQPFYQFGFVQFQSARLGCLCRRSSAGATQPQK